MKIFDRDSLPDPLRPLSNRTLAVCIACTLIALALAGCGGGSDDDPEQRKHEPEPRCAINPLECK